MSEKQGKAESKLRKHVIITSEDEKRRKNKLAEMRKKTNILSYKIKFHAREKQDDDDENIAAKKKITKYTRYQLEKVKTRKHHQKKQRHMVNIIIHR